MGKNEFVTVRVTSGLMEANIVKSKLESYGVPVILKYESVCVVFGLSMDGLGKVEIKVPKERREEALLLLE